MAKRKPKEVPVEEVKGAKDGADSVTIRVAPDLKRMAKWICEIENLSAVQLMDELVRDRLTERFQPYKEKADQAEAREKEREREREADLAELRRLRGKG